MLLIDCAAGISANVLYFSLVAHEVLVVVTPEPTSLTDAYALIKVLSTRYRQKRFRILINMAKHVREAKDVFRKLNKVSDRFLSVSLDFAGWVPLDEHLPMAVCQQKAVVEAFPKEESHQRRKLYFYRDSLLLSWALSRTMACACNWQILDSVTFNNVPTSFMVSSSK